MSAPWALRGRLLATCFLVVAVTPRLAAQVARITVDSAYDKFRDAAPRVYVRLSRLPTSVSGLSLRLIHERCGKGLPLCEFFARPLPDP